jgi:outer membrane protein TolC
VLRAISTALALVWLLLPAASTRAEDDPPAEPTRSPVAPATLHGNLALSLQDAIAMGLENNLNLEVQRHAPLIAYEDHEIAWGSYDPEFYGEANYQDVEAPNAFSINRQSTSQVKGVEGEGGFRGLVPWLGASYGLSLYSSRLETNSTIESVSPALRSIVNIGVTFPLLRGLIWNEPWTRVKTTRILRESELENFRREVMDTVRDIEGSYWSLIASEEQLRVEEKSLETATALLEQTRTQYEVGVVSKVEVTEAEAGVAARQFSRIVAENAYRTTQDQLIDLVLGSNLTAESKLVIQPTDRPDDYVPYDIDVDEAVRKAFAKRPELAIAQREIERQQVALKFAKNQRLPQFDLVASYGNEGLAGRENPSLSCAFGATRLPECADIPGVDDPGGPGTPDIPTITFPRTGVSVGRSYGDSFDNFFTQSAADQIVAGGIFSIPIPNTAGRHNVSRSELELRRATVAKRRVEQQIVLEVRKAARDLTSAQEGIEASKRRVLAAEEQLRAEKIRLEYGESTPFDVLLRESDLVGAETEKIVAYRVYRTSATDLDRFQGTILQTRNIAIDDVGRLR